MRAASGLQSPAMSLMPRMWAPAASSSVAMSHVVGEVVLVARRVGEVARVADGRLEEHPRLEHRVHRDAHVLDPVEAVEDPEEVDAGVGRLGHEVAHHVVRVVGVADRVRGPQQHLEQHVGHGLAQLGEAVPRVLAAGSAWPRRRWPRPRPPARAARAGGARSTPPAPSRSCVRKRVASSDWWASRKVVSVSSRRCCVAHPARRTRRAPAPAAGRGVPGGLARAAGSPPGSCGSRHVGRAPAGPPTSGLPFTRTSPMNASRRVARSRRGRKRKSSGVSSTKRVVYSPAAERPGG